MPHIAIIILNWNRPQLTIETVRSILKVRKVGFDYHIFLVDNGSTDNSAKLIKKAFNDQKSLSFLPLDTNRGFVDGNNFAIKHALKSKYDYVLLCNNDILVDPRFIKELLSSAQANSKIAIVGPKIYFAPGFEFHKKRYQKKDLGKIIWSAGGQMDWNNILGSNIGIDQPDRGQYNQITTDIDFISGCCMLIKTSLFSKIGLLDPAYFMYLEDVDFCQQAKKAGYKICYQPEAKIWHKNAGSSATGSHLHDYFIIRNRLYFASHFASLRPRLALFRQSLKFLGGKNKWKKQAVIDYYLKRLGRGSWK